MLRVQVQRGVRRQLRLRVPPQQLEDPALRVVRHADRLGPARVGGDRVVAAGHRLLQPGSVVRGGGSAAPGALVLLEQRGAEVLVGVGVGGDELHLRPGGAHARR